MLNRELTRSFADELRLQIGGDIGHPRVVLDLKRHGLIDIAGREDEVRAVEHPFVCRCTVLTHISHEVDIFLLRVGERHQQVLVDNIQILNSRHACSVINALRQCETGLQILVLIQCPAFVRQLVNSLHGLEMACSFRRTSRSRVIVRRCMIHIHSV